MRAIVIGSAAGGGLPQWNCVCANCETARAGGLQPRTQDSVAVSADGRRWVLLNASPDLRQQLAALGTLQPRALRESPVEGVVLTSGDVDHCLGLFVLREGSALSIHATAPLLGTLRTHDAMCRTLERWPGQARWVPLSPGRPRALVGVGGIPTGLVIEAIPVPGRPLPAHLIGLARPGPEHNVALLIRPRSGGPTLGYAPDVAHDAPGVRRLLRESDVLLFDGTFWSNDELVRMGAGSLRASDLAHWPIAGAGGSLEMLRILGRKRVVLTHINNTNPILWDGPERRAVLDAGVGVAHDGLELMS